MSETENFYRVPNPNYSGNDFKADTYRTEDFDKQKGIKVIFASLNVSGKYKVVDFLFDKEEYSSFEECSNWVKEHKQEFRGMNMADREITAFESTWFERTNGTEPTQEELDIINTNYTKVPFTADQVYVREMLLTNDQWSTHHLKLSRGFQRSIIESTPGRSLLLGHPETKATPAIPIGRFFSAFEYRDENGVVWNRAKFYIIKTEQNLHDRLQIDGGVWSHTSIGMETDWRQCSICGNDLYNSDLCKHVPGRKYKVTEVSPNIETNPEMAEDGEVYCGIVYRGKGLALEGSIVYFPELKGTKVLETWENYQKAYMSGDHGTAKEILLSGDENLKENGIEETAELLSGNNSAEVIDMETIVEEVKEEIEIENLEIVEEIVEKPKTEEYLELLSKIEELSAIVNATQKEATELKDNKVQELDRLSCLCNREAELKVLQNVFGEDLGKMPAESIIELENEWTKLVDEITPVQRQSGNTEVVVKENKILVNKSWI